MRRAASTLESVTRGTARVPVVALLTLGLLALPAAAQQVISAQAGLVNYVSGRSDINGTPISRGSDGLLKQMQEGDVLSVDRGAAEVLLTPGAFLRVSEGGSVQMLDTHLAHTQIDVLRGETMVEVAELYDDNSIIVHMQGGEATLTKKGVYYFDGDNSMIRVFDGKATARSEDTVVKLKKGRYVELSPTMKVKKFHTGDFKNTFLYAFSQNRSKRLAAANQRALRTSGYSSSSLQGPGWIYSPWIGGYSFLPGSGRLLSPFGGWYYNNLSWMMYPGFGYYPYGYGGNGSYGGLGVGQQVPTWGGINNPRAGGGQSFPGPVRSAGPSMPPSAPVARGRARGR